MHSNLCVAESHQGRQCAPQSQQETGEGGWRALLGGKQGTNLVGGTAEPHQPAPVPGQASLPMTTGHAGWQHEKSQN